MTDYIQVPVDLLSELAESLACELDARYPASVRYYESQDRKYQAEMEPVLTARRIIAAAPDHIADTRKMVASDVQGEPEGVRSLLVECERALCYPDPAQRQVTASKILRMLAASTAPAVQGEPVAFCEDAALSIAERTFSTEVDEQLASDIIQYAQRLHSLYATPQPAEQQPDVSGLVEALEAALMVMTSKEVRLEKQADAITMARAALAAHRKQGGVS